MGDPPQAPAKHQHCENAAMLDGATSRPVHCAETHLSDESPSSGDVIVRSDASTQTEPMSRPSSSMELLVTASTSTQRQCKVAVAVGAVVPMVKRLLLCCWRLCDLIMKQSAPAKGRLLRPCHLCYATATSRCCAWKPAGCSAEECA